MVKSLRALACVLAVTSLSTAFGQSSSSNAKPAEEHWNITAECQMVVLPQKVALPLIPDLLDDAKVEAAYAKVQALIAKGDAQLVANLVGRSKDEGRIVAESIEEMRYGTEYDPPQLPENAPDDPKVLKDWPVTGATPTAFETRNVGATLELEPKVESHGQWLSVGVVPKHVRFLRWNKIDAGKLANGERLIIEQPIFHVSKMTSTFMVRNGQHVLVGVHKVPDAPESMEFFLIKVQATLLQ